MEYSLRPFQPGDAAAVNEVALAAFAEYRPHYDSWPAFSRLVGNMASLAGNGELIVAAARERVAGAVVYVGPGTEKGRFFPAEWPILRMLVVAPDFRGLGIGRALAEECIRRAELDEALLVALHTSRIMTVALPMYERLGFRYLDKGPTVFGVPYCIYVKELSRGQRFSADGSGPARSPAGRAGLFPPTAKAPRADGRNRR